MQNMPQLMQNKTRKIQGILNKIPDNWLNCIESSRVMNTVIYPRQVVSCDNTDIYLQNLGSGGIYKILISKLVKMPIGVSRWREIIDLPDQQLKTAFTFAKLCTNSVFDQVFQYKIVTQILPTGKYLQRYQINQRLGPVYKMFTVRGYSLSQNLAMQSSYFVHLSMFGIRATQY
jgi:uncharacterized protein (DUF3820 family)